MSARGTFPPRCGGATSSRTGRITWARRRRGPRWRASPMRCSACSGRGSTRGSVDAGQSSYRGDGVLAQSPGGHDLADLRQRLAAAARTAQQRRRQEHRRLGRIHRLAGVGGRGGAQPRGRRARAGPAGLRGARRAEGRRASGRLRGHGRPWRHPGRGGLGRSRGPDLSTGDAAHLSLRREHHAGFPPRSPASPRAAPSTSPSRTRAAICSRRRFRKSPS